MHGQKKKGQKDKQRSTKRKLKTKDRVTRIQQKTHMLRNCEQFLLHADT